MYEDTLHHIIFLWHNIKQKLSIITFLLATKTELKLYIIICTCINMAHMYNSEFIHVHCILFFTRQNLTLHDNKYSDTHIFTGPEPFTLWTLGTTGVWEDRVPVANVLCSVCAGWFVQWKRGTGLFKGIMRFYSNYNIVPTLSLPLITVTHLILNTYFDK